VVRDAGLDVARPSAAGKVIFAVLFGTLAISASSLPPPQSSPQNESSQNAEVKRLYDQGRWEEVLRVAPSNQAAPAEMDLYRGLALAKLQRWQEARAALAAGERKAPRDKRFHLELAGIAYKRQGFRAAERELRRALRLDPQDSYALNFLATLYFLRGNLEAALEYWNRLGLPRIDEVDENPQPRTKAELVDRAFAFAPLSPLERRDFETTQARLDNLGVFSFYRWELRPKNDADDANSFDLIFHSLERDGFGPNKWIAALSTLRGLPYETVYPEYDNAFQSAVNFNSLLRFDPQKLRAYAEVSAPVSDQPRRRVRAWIDGRDENWNISETFFGAAQPISDLKLRKLEAGTEFRSVENGRWSWQTGVSFARRSFHNQSGLRPAAQPFFTDGNSLELSGRADYRLVSIPEKRFTVDSSASAAIGRFFAAPLGTYQRTSGSLRFRWFPKDQGDDYEVRSKLRAGGTFDSVPFDELSTLGVERDDNDLWLRGISATRDGRKGSSPMGRNYVLWNSEMAKIVYRGAFFQIRVGPLFDAGRIWDPSGLFGSQGWLWDPGAQLDVRVLDRLEVVFSYGHDMRSGQNTFFGATATGHE
jgi:Tetratricopeptide repeat